jgi:hypothetical protein
MNVLAPWVRGEDASREHMTAAGDQAFLPASTGGESATDRCQHCFQAGVRP